MRQVLLLDTHNHAFTQRMKQIGSDKRTQPQAIKGREEESKLELFGIGEGRRKPWLLLLGGRMGGISLEHFLPLAFGILGDHHFIYVFMMDGNRA